MHNFGTLLKKLRMNAGYTQKEFADKLNTTDTTVSNWENNKRYPDILVLRDISRILNVSYEDLLNPSATLERIADSSADFTVSTPSEANPSEESKQVSAHKVLTPLFCIGIIILFVLLPGLIHLFSTSSQSNFKFIEYHNSIETDYGQAYELIYLQKANLSLEEISAFADTIAEKWQNGEYPDATDPVLIVSFYFTKEDTDDCSKASFRSFYFKEYTP